MLDNRIKTFMTLYKVMNYSKTASLLNMTQPGVTQHIQYLENLYGVKLFTYDGKSLKATANADILKKCAASIIAEENAFLSELRKTGVDTLKIGATKTIGEYILPPKIAKFTEESDSNLELIIDNTKTLLQLLNEGVIDFAIVEGVFDKEKYFYRRFGKEKFTGICSASHPFANKKIPIEDTFSSALIIREKGSGTREIFERALALAGFSLDRYGKIISIGSFSVITELVAKTDGITFAYNPVALNNDRLATFTADGIELHGEFNFVYCNENIAKKKAELFMS